MPYAGFEQDRPYLVAKFKNPALPPESGLENEELWNRILSVAGTFAGEPHPVVKGRCFEYICRNMKIDVNPHDWFPAFGCYDRGRRPITPLIAKWDHEVNETLLAETNVILNARNEAGLHTVWKDFDHSVPDWDAILTLGFSGLRDRARQYRARHEAEGTLTDDARAYFDGLEITANAVLECIGRFIDFARKHHAGNPRIEAEIACLEQLRTGAPRNTYEVLQQIYLQFMFCEHIDRMQVRSLGNLDAMIGPYCERDLREGRYTEAEIREFFACFLMQWGSIDNYWGHPFYLGGTKPDGSTEYNDLSYLILDVFDRLNIPTPKIQLKIARNTPQRLLDTAFDMIRRGHNSLVFLSEESIRRTLMGVGYTREEARTCNITGCYEFSPRATSNGTCGGHVNMLKAVELVFFDGVDPKTGYRSACRARRLDEIKSFDDFYKASLDYLDDIIETVMVCANANEAQLHHINPASMYSLTIQNSLATAKDAFSNGSIYNMSGILLCGLGTMVDALMAVKSLVFEKGELTLAEFRDILKNNWQGNEKLRQRILRSREKFGNGIPEVDEWAALIGHYAATRINLRPNARGGFYLASGHCARQFIVMGERTGATPDGRLAGDEFAKNLSPTMGMDVKGLTALVKSVTTLDSIDYPGDFPLDVMMHPTSAEGEEGLAAMRALLFTYFEKHGVAIHFNIFDAKSLEEAQKHPEKYAGLQIRVCGWNVRFVELAKKEQDAYIERARRISE